MRKAMVLGIAAAAATAGCGEAHSENGNAGPAADRTYQVGNFDRIELAGAYDVVIQTGGAPGVRASGNQEAIDRLVVEVRDGVLSIHPRKRGGFQFGWSNKGKVKLTVTAPAIRGAELAGSGDIKIDRVAGDRFDGSIAGSGDLKVGQIEVGELKIGIAGSGSVKLAKGRATAAGYEIAGSGSVDARGVAAETASVSIAGSGDVSANASKTANVNIMGSGDVDLSGGAKCSVSKAGSGQIRCS